MKSITKVTIERSVKQNSPGGRWRPPGWRFWLMLALGLLGVVATVAYGTGWLP